MFNDFDDFQLHSDIEKALEYNKMNLRGPKKYIWTTATGEQLYIKNMSDSHLINAILMINRNAPIIYNRLLQEAYDTEYMLQGEMAIDSIQSIQRQLEASSPEEIIEEEIPQYEVMLKEIGKRNLTNKLKIKRKERNQNV